MALGHDAFWIVDFFPVSRAAMRHIGVRALLGRQTMSSD
jgi:hypothetical protein